MDDLMRTLYDYVLDHGEQAFLDSAAYRQAAADSLRWQKVLEQSLSPEQSALFSAYQNAETSCFLLELEAAFQATCELLRKLP